MPVVNTLQSNGNSTGTQHSNALLGNTWGMRQQKQAGGAILPAGTANQAASEHARQTLFPVTDSCRCHTCSTIKGKLHSTVHQVHAVLAWCPPEDEQAVSGHVHLPHGLANLDVSPQRPAAWRLVLVVVLRVVDNARDGHDGGLGVQQQLVAHLTQLQQHGTAQTGQERQRAGKRMCLHGVVAHLVADSWCLLAIKLWLCSLAVLPSKLVSLLVWHWQTMHSLQNLLQQLMAFPPWQHLLALPSSPHALTNLSRHSTLSITDSPVAIRQLLVLTHMPGMDWCVFWNR